MISRNWRGLARSILRRPLNQGVEFVIVTTWESIDSIRQFAGKPEDMAVVPAVVQAMMIEHDTRVAHYEIVNNDSPL